MSSTALLHGLNAFANAIRFTYRAGKFTGHVWFTYAVPAILFMADHLSDLISRIDWDEVFEVFLDCSKAIIALAITTFLVAKPYVIKLTRVLKKEIVASSSAIVYWVSCKTTPTVSVLFARMHA